MVFSLTSAQGPPPVAEQDSDRALRGTVVRPRWPSGQTGWRPPEFEESNFIRHFSASTTAGWLVRSCRALGAALAGWLNAGWLNHNMPRSAAKLKMQYCVGSRGWTSDRLGIFQIAPNLISSCRRGHASRELDILRIC